MPNKAPTKKSKSKSASVSVEQKIPAAKAKVAQKVAPKVSATPAAPPAKPVAAEVVVKVRGRKSKEKLIIAPEAAPLDIDAKRSRLKTLIALGKERGYLTYAEINDHLPDELVDAEQIESIIATFADMSIQVFDEAPAVEDMLLNQTSPAPVDAEEVEEQAEQALSTVDSEFG